MVFGMAKILVNEKHFFLVPKNKPTRVENNFLKMLYT